MQTDLASQIALEVEPETCVFKEKGQGDQEEICCGKSIAKVNEKLMKVMSPKSSAVSVVYSDASDSSFGGYFVQCGLDLVSGKEMRTSSSLR